MPEKFDPKHPKNLKNLNVPKSTTQHSQLAISNKTKGDKEIEPHPVVIGKKIEPPLEIAKEVTHTGELVATFLHDLHIALVGGIQTLEKILPPVRLFLVGVTSFWAALNAVYYSKKSTTHRTTQVVISVISTLTLVLSLMIPHLALAMLIVYASVELLREISHFIEALKDYWKLRKVRHALNAAQLKSIRDFILEKAVDIGLGLVAVAGAVLILFSTVAFMGLPLPVLGLGLLLTSGVGSILFHIALAIYQRISHWWQRRLAKMPSRDMGTTGTAPQLKNVSAQARPKRMKTFRARLQRLSSREESPEQQSTTNIYQTLDILKAQANEHKQLADSGWVKQPLATEEERQTKMEFWRSHRLAPYRHSVNEDSASADISLQTLRRTSRQAGAEGEKDEDEGEGNGQGKDEDYRPFHYD